MTIDELIHELATSRRLDGPGSVVTYGEDIREDDDDHFYGAWKGGAKAAGGRPAEPDRDVTAFWANDRQYVIRRDGDARLRDYERWAKEPEGGPPLWEYEGHVGDRDVALGMMETTWRIEGGSQHTALMMTSAIEEGFTSGMVWHPMKADKPNILDPSRTSREMVRAKYEQTQARLRDAPETFTLYRGLYGDASGNALESWTMDRDVAKGFGPNVIRGRVARQDVFMDLRGRPERELVVFGDKVELLGMERGVGREITVG